MNSPPRKSRRIASNAAKKEAQKKEEEKRQAEENAKQLKMQQEKKQQKRADAISKQNIPQGVNSSKVEFNTYQFQNLSYQQKIQFHRQQIASQTSRKLQKFTVTNGMIHEAISSTLDFKNGFDFSNEAKKSVQEIIADMATKVKKKQTSNNTMNNPLRGNVMLSLAPVSEEEELKQDIKKTEANFNLALQNWALHEKSAEK